MTQVQPNHNIKYRMGEERDARAIAKLYNMANNGLSEAWWTRQARMGESWLDVFARDIKEPSSIAYFARAVIAEVGDKIAGLLIAFPQEQVPPPEMLAALPSSEISILELRRLAEGSLYIAVVAVEPDYRGYGIAHNFVDMCMNLAEGAGMKEAFGIIHENNSEWLESFLRRGFAEKARRDVGDHVYYPSGSKWVLVTRQIETQEKKI